MADAPATADVEQLCEDLRRAVRDPHRLALRARIRGYVHARAVDRAPATRPPARPTPDPTLGDEALLETVEQLYRDLHDAPADQRLAREAEIRRYADRYRQVQQARLARPTPRPTDEGP